MNWSPLVAIGEGEGMHLNRSEYAAGVSRCEGYRLVAALGIFLECTRALPSVFIG